MTIVEAANKILEHFNNKESFCMDEDYGSLMQISESPTEDKIAFILALEDLEKNDFIKSHISNKKKIYILRKPLNSYDQNINLGGFTCNMIAKIINDFCNKIKDKRDYCEARNITEKDIRNLIFLASLSSTNQEDKENIDKI